jgi:hypothetical protein
MERVIVEGINGGGQRIWMVVTISEAGDWKWIETFDNEAEARNWILHS